MPTRIAKKKIVKALPVSHGFLEVPEIPAEIPLTVTLYGDGADGYRIQVRENHELGLQVVSVKENHNASWVTEIVLKSLPNIAFSTLAELRETLDMLK